MEKDGKALHEREIAKGLCLCLRFGLCLTI